MTGNFQTPQNEKSFSAIVDQAILETGQFQMILSAIQYGNATLRECHALGLFYKDLIEDSVVATANPHIFTQPDKFRRLRTAKYANCGIYPRLKLPGRQLQDECEYYYASDDYFVFKGVQIGESIDTAIYYWPKSFSYYTILGASNTANLAGSGYSTRPAYFDEYTGVWMYLTSAIPPVYATTLGDPTAEALARLNTLNWMLKDWPHLVLEGIKAKIFTVKGDSRGPTSFSLYKSFQNDLKSSTGFESEDA